MEEEMDLMKEFNKVYGSDQNSDELENDGEQVNTAPATEEEISKISNSRLTPAELIRKWEFNDKWEKLLKDPNLFIKNGIYYTWVPNEKLANNFQYFSLRTKDNEEAKKRAKEIVQAIYREEVEK